MAKFRYALLVEKVLVDARTRGTSLINLIEGFETPQLPVPAGFFEVFSVWERDEASEAIEVRLVPEDPMGQELLGAAATEKLEGEKGTHRWIARMSDWQISAPGRWTLKAEMLEGGSWVTQARLTLNVALSGESTA